MGVGSGGAVLSATRDTYLKAVLLGRDELMGSAASDRTFG